MVADKWSVLVVHALLSGTKRHHELMDEVEGISQKMLTQTLRELELNGLLERTVFAEVPPRVEYSLTPIGRTLGGPVKRLAAWAEAHAYELLAARQANAVR
ncbi:MAG: helix-turn-helix domain-containing protein [Mycobacteriales bacterium]